MLTGTSPAEQSPPFDRLAVHGFGPLRGALECEAREHEVASGAGDSSTQGTVTQHADERPSPRGRGCRRLRTRPPGDPEPSPRATPATSLQSATAGPRALPAGRRGAAAL